MQQATCVRCFQDVLLSLLDWAVPRANISYKTTSSTSAWKGITFHLTERMPEAAAEQAPIGSSKRHRGLPRAGVRVWAWTPGTHNGAREEGVRLPQTTLLQTKPSPLRVSQSPQGHSFSFKLTHLDTTMPSEPAKIALNTSRIIFPSAIPSCWYASGCASTETCPYKTLHLFLKTQKAAKERNCAFQCI